MHLASSQRLFEEEYNDYDLNGLCLEFQNRSEALRSYCIDQSYILESAKFNWLRTNLPLLVQKGHRILLFSQWTSIMDIMQGLLNNLGYAFAVRWFHRCPRATDAY